MKRIAIALVAIMLVIILAFGMFACNKDKGNTTDNNNTIDNGNTDNNPGGDNTPEGNKNNAVTDKVGDTHYAAPQASNITTAEVDELLVPFANKIVNVALPSTSNTTSPMTSR